MFLLLIGELDNCAHDYQQILTARHRLAVSFPGILSICLQSDLKDAWDHK
jgi:hypothetical protein